MPSFGKDRGRRVDGKVVGRDQDAGGNQGHDGHETFHQHGAVADEKDVPFVADHLGSGAGADDGMETGQGAAGDGDKDKGEDRAGNRWDRRHWTNLVIGSIRKVGRTKKIPRARAAMVPIFR